MTPICPKCGADVSAPASQVVNVGNVWSVYALCPSCGSVLGVTADPKRNPILKT